MRTKLDERLVDPALYVASGTAMLDTLQRKRVEVMAGLEKAEELWILALERLERAREE